MSLDNNTLQFITLSLVKSHFGFTDNQDDGILLQIVQSCNLEIKKRITPIVDSLDSIEGSIHFQPGQDAALVYCEAEKLRQINKQHDKAKTTLETFETMMESYLGSLRAQAPVRTSRQLASRDTDPEDDYYGTRHNF
jgi:hypothetical protein